MYTEAPGPLLTRYTHTHTHTHGVRVQELRERELIIEHRTLLMLMLLLLKQCVFLRHIYLFIRFDCVRMGASAPAHKTRLIICELARAPLFVCVYVYVLVHVLGVFLRFRLCICYTYISLVDDGDVFSVVVVVSVLVLCFYFCCWFSIHFESHIYECECAFFLQLFFVSFIYSPSFHFIYINIIYTYGGGEHTLFFRMFISFLLCICMMYEYVCVSVFLSLYRPFILSFFECAFVL